MKTDSPQTCAQLCAPDQIVSQWTAVANSIDPQQPGPVEMPDANAVRAWCEAMLNDEQALRALAARSRRHGNGFYKFVLGRDRGCVRLHVWVDGVVGEENIHDHRWSFASRVLLGTLQSTVWEPSTSPPAVGAKRQDWLRVHRCIWHDEGGSSRFVRMGRTWLRCTQRQAHPAGVAYTMDPHTLHRIHTPHSEAWVATLVFTSPSFRTHTRLFTDRPVVQEHEHEDPLTLDITREVLTGLVARLAAGA